MNQIIAEFKTKTVFGNDLIYPVNTTAKRLAELTGKKTVDHNDIKKIEQIGIIVMLDAVEFHLSNN